MMTPRCLDRTEELARRRVWIGMAVAISALASRAQAETHPLIYLPAGKHEPARVELRVDSFLVVRVTCDGPRRLLFDFPKDDSYQSLLPSERRKPLEFGFDQGPTYRLPTQDGPRRRIGRLELTPRVLTKLDRSHRAEFWGPSEMGEPWAMLNLGALRRLVRGCSQTSRA